MDENTINTAFDLINHARKDLLKASDNQAEARKVLDEKKIKVFADGLIDGKNETERKAQYALYTAEEEKKVEEKERLYAMTQMSFDLANYEVNRVKLLVQFLSLSQGEK